MVKNTTLDIETLRKLPKDKLTFFIYYKRLKTQLQKIKWDRHLSNETKIEFYSIRDYDYNAYALLQKVFKRLGWELKMTLFRKMEDKKENLYSWSLRKY